jgi:flagellar motor switch protein FliN
MSSSPTLSFSSEPAQDAPASSHPFADVEDVVCRVDVVLGTGSITVRDCLKLKRLSVIRLDQSAGADLDVSVHGVPIVSGEIMIIDESTAVRVTAVKPPPGAGRRA